MLRSVAPAVAIAGDVVSIKIDGELGALAAAIGPDAAPMEVSAGALACALQPASVALANTSGGAAEVTASCALTRCVAGAHNVSVRLPHLGYAAGNVTLQCRLQVLATTPNAGSTAGGRNLAAA